jgi:hypothetical protein
VPSALLRFSFLRCAQDKRSNSNRRDAKDAEVQSPNVRAKPSETVSGASLASLGARPRHDRRVIRTSCGASLTANGQRLTTNGRFPVPLSVSRSPSPMTSPTAPGAMPMRRGCSKYGEQTNRLDNLSQKGPTMSQMGPCDSVLHSGMLRHPVQYPPDCRRLPSDWSSRVFPSRLV